MDFTSFQSETMIEAVKSFLQGLSYDEIQADLKVLRNMKLLSQEEYEQILQWAKTQKREQETQVLYKRPSGEDESKDTVDLQEEPKKHFEDENDRESLPEEISEKDANEIPEEFSNIKTFGASIIKSAVVVKKKDGYYVYSEDKTKKLGGPYKTKEEAEKRLRQVEYYKHQNK